MPQGRTGPEAFRSSHKIATLQSSLHRASPGWEPMDQFGYFPHRHAKHPIHNPLWKKKGHRTDHRQQKVKETDQPRVNSEVPGVPRELPLSFPEDRQPPEAGWKKRWAVLLRLSGLRDCTSVRYCIYPSSRTGRMIRNSVKRGREQGQEIINTKQTAPGIKLLQLAGLLHISRILYFFSPCLIKKEPIYKGKEFQTVIIS